MRVWNLPYLWGKYNGLRLDLDDIFGPLNQEEYSAWGKYRSDALSVLDEQELFPAEGHGELVEAVADISATILFTRRDSQRALEAAEEGAEHGEQDMQVVAAVVESVAQLCLIEHWYSREVVEEDAQD